MASSAVRVVIHSCRELLPRRGGAADMRPYCSYRFPGFAAPHDTLLAAGDCPQFGDSKLFPLARTDALARQLADLDLELSVFDDADSDAAEAGLVGMTALKLRPLAEGLPIEGEWTLFNRAKQPVGRISISISWVAPLDKPSPGLHSLGGGGLHPHPQPQLQLQRQGAGLAALDSLREPAPYAPQPPSLTASGEVVNTLARSQIEALSARGTPRYDAAARESVDAAIVIGITRLLLGAAAASPDVRQLLVLFDLGAQDLYAEQELRTPVVARHDRSAEFAFRRSFPAGTAARAAFARLLREPSPEVRFAVVTPRQAGAGRGRDQGPAYDLLGEAVVSLRDIRDYGDLVDQEVTVELKGRSVGKLQVTVIAQRLLQSV